MKTWIKVLVMLCTVVAFGQSHTVAGKLEPVNTDGLYLIPIPQTVRPYASADMRDFRIWDVKGNQVPYFVQPTTSYTNTTVSNFSAFTILSSTRIADSSATYVFENPDKTINQAVLSIANYQGRKNYRLEGSHDENQWFGIVNRGELQDLNHPEDTSVYKIIDFPICNYPYLKIVFDDRNSLPLNLLEIGKATAETINLVPVAMEELQTADITFSEKDKTTQIHISFERPQTINQLRLDIAAPELYSRRATLYTVYEREVNRNMETYRKTITSFDIRSDNALVFDVTNIVTQDLYLDIENKDNPKLQIPSIHIMQKPVYVVANLKAQQAYTITAGDEALSTPDYDISEVTNTIKRGLPIANISTVTYIESKKPLEESRSFWQHPWFMWCCIGLAALIIFYYAFTLIKDMNANTK
ncbi:DUF3999 family protein [Formosa undariae]|uniref:DUF3999 family protein n=1 Tax=Formosa undariae TaxID=1325436 RepID=A0ABV5EY91_9FLAO